MHLQDSVDEMKKFNARRKLKVIYMFNNSMFSVHGRYSGLMVSAVTYPSKALCMSLSWAGVIFFCFLGQDITLTVPVLVQKYKGDLWS